MRRWVQLAIVLLVLGILVALMMPAVVQVRLAAVRTECINAMKFQALGLHGYRSGREHFPQGLQPIGGWRKNEHMADLPYDKRLSWQYEVDPYMGSRMDLSPRARPDLPWDAPEAREFNSVARLFCLCPSQAVTTSENGYALTHYVGVAGIGKDAALLPLGSPGVGFFGYERQITIADIKDGSQTTICIMETGTANGPWVQGGFSTVRGLDPNGGTYLGTSGQFSSGHRSTTVAFVDASVRTFAEDTSPRILEALVTIAGGEELAEGWDN